MIARLRAARYDGHPPTSSLARRSFSEGG
jgi:hypothetical protein